MKMKNVFIVYTINEDGELEVHPAFDGMEFVNPQAVFNHLRETEVRISEAKQQQIPANEEDTDLMDEVEDTELIILESWIINEDQENLKRERLVEHSPGTNSPSEVVRLQKQVQELMKQMAALKKKPTTDK